MVHVDHSHSMKHLLDAVNPQISTPRVFKKHLAAGMRQF